MQLLFKGIDGTTYCPVKYIYFGTREKGNNYRHFW
jgi:hypothetical protein